MTYRTVVLKFLNAVQPTAGLGNARDQVEAQGTVDRPIGIGRCRSSFVNGRFAQSLQGLVADLFLASPVGHLYQIQGFAVMGIKNHLIQLIPRQIGIDRAVLATVQYHRQRTPVSTYPKTMGAAFFKVATA